MTEKQKLVRIFHLMKKMDKHGPGSYNISKNRIFFILVKTNRCMVTYRSASPTKARLPNLKKMPGPAHYYAKDDLCYN